MTSFAYEIRDGSGRNCRGVVRAEDIDEAATLLRKPGVTILDIHPETADQAAPLFGVSRRIKRDEVIFFVNQLAVMVETGVRLTDALDAIADQTESPGLKRVLRDVCDEVKGGSEFSAALSKHPKVFSGVFVALMRASEASGTMAAMLHRLSGYMKQERTTRKQIKGAMTYPLCMLGFCVIVVVAMLVFILPRFEKIYAGKSVALPLPTRMLLAMSHGITDHWPFVILGLAAVITAAYMYFRTPEGRAFLSRLRIRIPVIGGMYRKVYLARSLRTMGSMIAAGVDVLDGLEITAQAVGNESYARVWRDLAEHVSEGATFAEHLYTSKIIPRTVAQMVDAGERTGKLGAVMNRVAEFCEDDLKIAVKTLTSMIEPTMIIIMGVIIGGIAMALLLPVFSLSKVVAY